MKNPQIIVIILLAIAVVGLGVFAGVGKTTKLNNKK